MQNASMGPWNIISMSSVIYRVKSTSRSVLSLKCQKLTAASFHNCQPLLYKEDYTRLGIPQNATKDEIKSAYFVKAKQLHPDTHSSDSEATQAEFFELNEAYKRLMYESKHGTGSFDKSDPRNDPRRMEYWEIRKRRQSPREIKFEEEMENKARDRERRVMRRAGLALAIGVFFGTIFPAVFVGQDDYENGFSHGCQCDRCQLKKLRQNPTITHLTRSNDRTSASNDAVHAEFHK
eukprot:TRINITY_DN9939_c0_g1_i1.p1 TRINITY_DN9939_c0_g1~~TRINITY_DN9939_c0_g1_i1.p1  ORF type:complete len:235 (-),score=60.78 TRINITY_DN9939_c0_g1_i1:96-800(-)